MKNVGKKVLSLFIIFTMFFTTAFTVQASPVDDSWLPLRAVFEEGGATVAWQGEDATIHIDLDGFDFVFHTRQPVVYMNGVSVALQDGIALHDGLSFFTLDDLGIIQGVLDQMMLEAFLEDGAIVFTTGRFGYGTPEQNELVASILGNEYTAERFAIYFHWYNTIHELGHAIMVFNSEERPHVVEEEQLVNAFAVAFWRHFGEEEKLNQLEFIVGYALENFISPADEGVSHLDYAREMFDTGRFEEFFNFNDYGWFQFNLVREALLDTRSLEEILAEMGVDVQAMPQRTLTYETLNEEAVLQIIADAISILREMGALTPDAFIAFDNDPNMHMMSIISGEDARDLVEAGSLIPILQPADR